MKQLFLTLLTCFFCSINMMAIESVSSLNNQVGFYGVTYNIDGTLVTYDAGTEDAHSQISCEYATVTNGMGINGIVNIIPCFEFGQIYNVWDYNLHEYAYDYANDQWVYSTTWYLLPVTGIFDRAFYNNDVITEVTIPYSIKTIGYEAFYSASELKKVSITANSIEIDRYAFRGCKALKELNLPSSIASIGDNAFLDCTALKKVDLPLHITKMGNGVFSNSGLEEVNIPYTWTVIPEKTFASTNLKSITIPSAIDTIKAGAFSRCFNMGTIYWNAKNCATNGSTWNYAPFISCNLSRLFIGESVESIGYYMFAYCLQDPNDTITCYAKTPPTITYSTFISCYDNAVLCVPKSSLDLYKTTSPWSNFANIVGINEPGDVNGDGGINISDVTSLIDLLLSGGEISAGADVNGDGQVNISDVTALIDYLLSGSW